ncbi:hypothetical protein [Alteromonas gracilis]|uniref:hypothetical protein n=1 Tax=Alteromonas gracilis TaxID=1479524 RepID=UPI0030CEACA7
MTYGRTSRNVKAPTEAQSGMVVMSIVIILLVTTTLLTKFTAQRIQAYQDMTKAINSTVETEIRLVQAQRDIGRQLRTKNVESIILSETDISYDIVSTQLEGDKQQALAQYIVSVSTANYTATYTEQYLRYPAIINTAQLALPITSFDDITDQLFNRQLGELSPLYFPDIVALDNCDTLLAGQHYWITGDCKLSSSGLKGNSAKSPMLIIVENGDIHLSASTAFYGLLVQISDNGSNYSLKVENGASIVGALTSNKTLNTMLMGDVNHSQETLNMLQQQPALQKVIPIPGSWYASTE